MELFINVFYVFLGILLAMTVARFFLGVWLRRNFPKIKR